MLLVVTGTGFWTVGCNSLLPSRSASAESRWASYEQAQKSFERIVPYHTTTNDLALLGFYPSVSPNVKILTYVDLVPIFMPNPGIQKKDLPPAVNECLDAREEGFAYFVDLQNTHSQRYGNLFLDVFGFKRKTHETGWQFKGLILIKNGVVVYKLSSGEPRISRDEKQVKPLGPLQELDSILFHVVTVPQ